MTWDDWASRHATLFGLQSEADLAMLREFAGLFAEGGWTADEMVLATRKLALTDPPRFRTDHLAGLLTAARTRRALEMARGPSGGEIGPPGAICAICEGTGMVCDLPNPDSLQRDRWTTMAASCVCAVGAWLRRNQGDRPLLAYGDYLTLVPDWRERVAARERERRAYSRARQTATQLDRVMGQLLARVRTMRETNEYHEE